MTKIIEEFYQLHPELKEKHKKKKKKYKTIGLSIITQTLYKLYQLEQINCLIDADTIRNNEYSITDLRELLKKDYIYGDEKGYIRLTDDGIDYVQACIANPSYCPTSTRAWLLEATTKTLPDGRESPMQSIAIPKQQKRQSSCEFNENEIELKSLIKQLAKQLNKSEYEITVLIAEERIKKCHGCRKMAIHHLNKSRPDGLAALCINCRKE